VERPLSRKTASSERYEFGRIGGQAIDEQVVVQTLNQITVLLSSQRASYGNRRNFQIAREFVNTKNTRRLRAVSYKFCPVHRVYL